MDFGGDMVSHQSHDALGVTGGDCQAAVDQAHIEPVDPNAAVGIEQNLADPGIIQPRQQMRAKRRA